MFQTFWTILTKVNIESFRNPIFCETLRVERLSNKNIIP